MIEVIGNTANSYIKPQISTSLSSEQSETVDSILSGFDSTSLTEADAQSIIEQLKEAGIQPGKGLADAFAELGFDAKEVGDLAGVTNGQRPPPPPPESQSEQALPANSTFSIQA